MNTKVDISNTIINTERLTLRPWRKEDVQDFYEYASVDGVGQPAGWLPHKSIEESAAILDMFIEGKHALALEHNGKVIGSISIDEYDEAEFPEFSDKTVVELGYQLAKDHWGKGLMPETVKAVISYLFNTVNVDIIICCHFNDNDQSRRVQEKCGFKHYKPLQLETRAGDIKASWSSIIRKEDWI